MDKVILDLMPTSGTFGFVPTRVLPRVLEDSVVAGLGSAQLASPLGPRDAAKIIEAPAVIGMEDGTPSVTFDCLEGPLGS
ncbi:hypothetical protein ACLOJK_002475 [Asimina triloba]